MTVIKLLTVEELLNELHRRDVDSAWVVTHDTQTGRAGLEATEGQRKIRLELDEPQPS